MEFVNLKKTLGLVFIFIMIPLWAMSQNITVKGNVKEASGDALPGVSIQQVGASTGTVTDLDGNFSISVPTNAKLTFSYVGYNSQTVPVAGKRTLNIVLKEDLKSLSEVVVIGYGTAKRSDISGSVTSINAENMMKRSPINLAQGLQGAAAGVIVTQQDGSPEASAAIRIRGVGTINGSADPLYVVDGVQVGTNANFLNPQDIEHIEILKDASATAIYGARGANGVVMITTKHGQKGAVHLDVSANWGIQTLSSTLNTLDADQYANAVRLGRAADGAVPIMAIWNTKYDGQRKTIDWQKEMTRSALRQMYTASLSGGTDKMQGNFSAGYLDNEGMVVNSKYRRMNLRGTLKAQVTSYLEVGGDVNFTHSVSRGSNATLGNNVNLSSLRDYATAVPTMDYTDDAGNIIHPNVVNSDGTYGTFWQSSAGAEVPKSADNFYARQMELNSPTRTNRLLANVYVDITPFKGLHLHSIYSYGHTATDNSSWTPKRPRYNNGAAVTLIGIDANEAFSLSQSSGYDKSIETYLTYNWSNDIHNVTVMAGNSVSKSFGSWVNASAENFPGSNIRDIGLTNDLDTKTGGGAFNLETRFISYYGRLMYSLMDRYNLTATVRRDGSSNFGSGNRWGTFPSFAASWRISEEPFMKNLPEVTNVKLRFGWGRTGNAGSATNLATPQLSSSGIMYHFYADGASTQTFNTANGLAQASVIDTNLKWETNEQWNVGLDFSLLNNDLNVTLDYFVRNSKDLLLYQSLRPSTGWNNVYTNFGEIRNKGFEFNVAYNHRINNDWTIGATVNGSTLSNKIIKSGLDIMNTCDRNDGVSMGDGSNMGTVSGTAMWWNNHSICREGYAVGSFYGYRADGLFTSQTELDELNAKAKAAGFTDGYQVSTTKLGDVKYKDLNADGHIDEKDMDVLGNGFPDLNFGINLSATYKNWDASVYMYGVLGQDILSYSAMRLSTITPSDDNVSNILKSAYNDAWSATNTSGTLPRLTIVDLNHNTRCSDLWVKNGDFLKISNLQIGYTFPKNWLKPLQISGARAYVSVSNLCCLSGYNKYGDPECGQGGVLWTGLDTGRYPMPRTYAFGLSVQF